MLNVWAIHRDPQLWDNPLEFRPERRICVGIPLAERMLMFLMASLLHSFEWKLPYDTELDLSDKFGIIIKKLKPLVVIPTPRLSNSELY
ncbi:hypothetical protein JRO89_XS13G0050000 [Xanthoceras sorbifolium]|uniref:Cytochrome P450 n=1 Tax=Xanthoceras sorbifolium TaxID=99658 RepID=A0ABQ8H6M7_9ROSI|nr:hypothetical protein JRO89_XS13G0050000 [Xanthoceras sorbifolium]